MTEKRFVAIGVEWTDGFIQDHIGDRDLFNVGAVCNLLNELSEENEQLKSKNKILLEHCDDLQERNDRQAKTIRKLYNLIEKQDWEALTAIIEELNKAEEQLKIEMECYEQ